MSVDGFRDSNSEQCEEVDQNECRSVKQFTTSIFLKSLVKIKTCNFSLQLRRHMGYRFGPACGNYECSLRPIPSLLHGVIDHLIQWQLIPEYKRPNGCIINFFEEGEFSQPFLKPPRLDQPLSTLLLSESTMAFGCILMNENDGNYKGSLMLSLKKGALSIWD